MFDRILNTSWIRHSKDHCLKKVHIRNFSGPYFPAFGLNTGRYGVSLRIQSECGKIRTRKTPSTNTFYAVGVMDMVTTCWTVSCCFSNISTKKKIQKTPRKIVCWVELPLWNFSVFTYKFIKRLLLQRCFPEIKYS